LSSDYHRNFESHPLSRVLGLDPLEVLAPKDDFLQSLSLDYSTLLFNHIPAIFFVLHLVYEEFKLNLLMGEENRSLVVLLVQLARYAKLTDAVCCVVSLDVFFFYGEIWGLPTVEQTFMFLKEMNK